MKKGIKILLKIVIVTTTILILFLFGLKYYIDNHRELIFDKFEEWYDTNYYGELSFSDISSTTFKNFPYISFNIKNLILKDSISNFKSGTIEFDEINFLVSFKNILQKDIHFKSLELKNGHLNLQTLKQEDSIRKLFSKRTINQFSEKKITHNWFTKNGIKIKLSNTSVSIIDSSKQKQIKSHINNIDTQLFFENENVISSSIKMDILINELGLNLKNGSFLKNTNLIGEFSATINKTKKQVTIPFFDLDINKQHFKTSAIINTNAPGSFEFIIENPSTNFKETSVLLTENIQNKLNGIQIVNPIYTHTTLKGSFGPESQPDIEILCNTKNNEIILNDKTIFRNTSFKSNFSNKISNNFGANKKDFTIDIDDFETKIDSILLNFKHLNLKSLTQTTTLQPELILTVEKGNFLMSNFEKRKRITAYINKVNTQILFHKNLLTASTSIDVQMKEMGLNLNNGTFFNNANLSGIFKLSYDKSKHQIFVPWFNLNIDTQTFKTMANISTKNGGSFNFQLENPTTHFETTRKLLSQNIQEKLKFYQVSNPIYTYAQLQGSFKYGSNPLVKILGELKNNKITIKNEKFDNVTFKANFVNRIYKNGITNNERKKDVQIIFSNLSANYDAIPLSFNYATLTSSPEVKTYADYEFEVHEKTKVLNDFFKNTEYIFSNGTVDFITRYKGEITNLQELYNTSNSTLKIKNSNLFQKSLSLEIPIENLEIDIENKNGYLKSLIIPIKNPKNTLNFNGEINNVVPLILGKKAPIKTDVEIYSNNLIWKDFFSMFMKSKKLKKQDSLKPADEFIFNETLREIYTKFNPQFNLSINRFQYKKTIIDSLFFELNLNDKMLSLNNFQFNYGKGSIDLKMFFDISTINKTPFDLNLIAENISLNRFLKEFNYFELKSLQEAEIIEGDVSLETQMKGIIHESNGLNTKTLEGDVIFDLKNLQLSGFQPLEKIGNKIFKKRRFENIKFAEISDTLSIANRTVQIPQLEIQSTAFNLFVEGQLNYDFNTNIWVSIPLSNLKKRDLIHIPNKKGYVESGKKVYVQVIDDGTGKLEYKFHLSDKKLIEYRRSLEGITNSKKKKKTKIK